MSNEQLNTLEQKVFEATDRGKDIFTHYLNTPFEVGQMVQPSRFVKMKVDFSEKYDNYFLTLTTKDESGVMKPKNFNPTFFVQARLNMSKLDALQDIIYVMNLDVDKQEGNQQGEPESTQGNSNGPKSFEL